MQKCGLTATDTKAGRDPGFLLLQNAFFSLFFSSIIKAKLYERCITNKEGIMEYKQSGNYKDLDDYVFQKTGKHIADLDSKTSYVVRDMDKAAARIRKAIKNREHMEVYTDYDLDGVGSAGQMLLLFRALGAGNYNIRVPRRFSDGYGIQTQQISTMPDSGLLIVADNGIKAHDAVAAAKAKGMDVIILDHHLPDELDGRILVPDADILIDPAAISEGNTFKGYCAGGLVNSLFHMLVQNEDFCRKADAMAALSTVADVVPLLDANRQIVKRGLQVMNSGGATAGLQAVIDAAGLTGIVNSESIAFKLAPMFNTPGRLYDTGGFSATKILVEEDKNQALINAANLNALNKKRIEDVKSVIDGIQQDSTLPVQIIRADDIPAGIFGIIAGKIQEKTGKPAFVYGVSNGIAKGSARSNDEKTNNVSDMLVKVKDLMLKFGGHPGAAGFSFDASNEAAFISRMMEYPVVPPPDYLTFDLYLDEKDIRQTRMVMDFIEPFGKSMELPVFRVEYHASCDPFWRPMGKGEHLEITLQDKIKGVAFNLMEKFVAEGKPKDMVLYGTPFWDHYKGTANVKFRITDLERLR